MNHIKYEVLCLFYVQFSIIMDILYTYLYGVVVPVGSKIIIILFTVIIIM